MAFWGSKYVEGRCKGSVKGWRRVLCLMVVFQSLGIRVEGFGFRIWLQGLVGIYSLKVLGLGRWVLGLGLPFYRFCRGSGFRCCVSSFWVWSKGCLSRGNLKNKATGGSRVSPYFLRF